MVRRLERYGSVSTVIPGVPGFNLAMLFTPERSPSAELVFGLMGTAEAIGCGLLTVSGTIGCGLSKGVASAATGETSVATAPPCGGADVLGKTSVVGSGCASGCGLGGTELLGR